MDYVLFDLGGGLKGANPPNNVYTYGHKNYWTSRCQDWCNLKKGDNSPPKRVYTYRHKNYGKDLYDIYNLDSK